MLCPQGGVRLQDGHDGGQIVIPNNRGRVEICNNDVWGTVCDDSWTSVEAAIVCIQLGLPSSSRFARTVKCKM